MGKWLPTAAAALTIGAASAAGAVFGQPKPSRPLPQAGAGAGAGAGEQAKRGKYLVQAGDCMACHTLPGEPAFAGGRPIQTPFGVILSANITPDETGIGGWTADQFYRALHSGVDDDGHRLYPAFPYNYYTKISRADADAMFAYLKSIKPVRHEFARNKLPFPFNIRFLMVFWNWLSFKEGEFRPDPAQSPEWNRGAYLVQGPGHCGACHTPKNLLGGPKRDEFLHGGHFGQWFAPDLTANRRTGLGSWSRDQLIEFLKTGRNAHAGAAGEMGEVVAFSTSKMSDADLRAVAAYLGSLPASPARNPAAPDPAAMRRGKAIFEDECSACHRMDGSGVPTEFPPLIGDANLQQSDPATVIRFILEGARNTPTDARPTPLTMPPFGWKLSDQQVADVATFIRNVGGNRAAPVSARQVNALRAKLPSPSSGAGASAPPPSARPNPRTLAPAQTGGAAGSS